MQVMELISRGYYHDAMELLNCKSVEELNLLSKWLNVERWTTTETQLKGIMSADEYTKYVEATKTFDIFKDFDAYYVDFITYFNIDLLKDEIDYIRFNWFLNALMSKEESVISKRLSFRNYKANKNDNTEYKKAMNENKKRYSLVQEDTQRIYETVIGGGEIGATSSSSKTKN